jgi:cytochrome c-type biogenesis protein CcmE
MGKVFISLVAVFILVGGALVYQATRSTSSLVLTPSELQKKAPSGELARVRVGGKVVGPIEYQVDPSFVLSFGVKDGKEGGSSVVVPVVYSNVKPDMFAEERDVLIDGDLVQGRLIAAQLQTQCPSKYEPALPDSHPSQAKK